MKILITGGMGFVGANLAKHLTYQGHNVTTLDNLVRRGSEYNIGEFKKLGIKFVHGDIRNKEDIVGSYDVICECSAQPSAIDGYANPIYDFTNNTLGLMNVLEHARTTGAAIIFWSTNKVYSGDKINAIPTYEEETRYVWVRPENNIVGFDYEHGISNKFTVDGGQHSIYGMTKIMSDLACQEYYDAFRVPVVVNRFSCLAGQGQFGKCAQGWVAWFAIANHFNMPVDLIGWKGKQVRDVLFIDDICELINTEIDCIGKIAGQVFNVGGGKDNTVSLLEAISIIEKITGKKMTPHYEIAPRKADHCVYITDIRKITDMTVWKPKVSLEAGYEKIIKWVSDNEKQLKELYV